jgi:hypothetical protein
MTDAATRSALAADLRARAQAILTDTGWLDLFARHFGAVAATGSFSYDLMVWPDIDIHMPVEPNARAEWLALGIEINRGLNAAGCRLHRAHYWDDYVDPHPLGAGLYWGIEFRDRDDTPWKADLWGWAPDDYEKRQARDAELKSALAKADRDLILRLKLEARAKPGYYGTIVGSWDLYRFAIAGAGDTLEALERWKAESKVL